MKAVRCSNGHWYDSETYDKCPHCGQPNATIQVDSNQTKIPEKKGFGLFKKEKKNKNAVAPAVVQSNISVGGKANTNTSSTSDEVTERFFADIDDDKTISMFETSEAGEEKTLVPNSESGGEKTAFAEKESTSESLVATVQRISAMDEGKTLSYFNAMSSQKDSSSDTASIAKVAEPVVGWLVAISGEHLGESFQLYAGKNTIGRNNSNKVVLGLDQSISRENHATIIYEPKRREFYVQSGSSDGLIYLNDSFVNGSQIMKEKDILEIGLSKLIFIPLCGMDFSWEQYM